jgi:hypothetical protein
MKSLPTFRTKVLERTFWTFVQAGLAVVTVEAFDLPPVYLPVFAAVLAVVKGYVAKRVGDPTDPSIFAPGQG